MDWGDRLHIYTRQSSSIPHAHHLVFEIWKTQGGGAALPVKKESNPWTCCYLYSISQIGGFVLDFEIFFELVCISSDLKERGEEHWHHGLGSLHLRTCRSGLYTLQSLGRNGPKIPRCKMLALSIIIIFGICIF